MRAVFAAVLASLLAASCSDPVAPASPTPVAPTTTERFSGRLDVGGSNVHAFTVSQVGRVQVTLAGPPAGVRVALAIGTPLGAACQPASRVEAESSQSPQLSGTATTAGVYCVSVTATGSVTEAVVYTVAIAHS
ncbi:MAG: hypothetical protein IT561_12465 [Alphaproteobacteria bacterium]|nr:hypothetical protein [Alphaproteobacteria bacterium]